MASVVIAGDVSGTCTLQAANAAGTTVLTLPTTSGTLVATGGSPTFTTINATNVIASANSNAAVFTSGLGNASAPAYSFTGDTNTGIFSPTADTIAFTEGGVESMRINASGNVIIGAASNTYGGNFGLFSSGNTRLDIATTGATSQQILSFGQNGTARWQLISDLAASGSGAFDFVQPGTGSRMQLDSSGNLKFNSGYGSVATAYGCRAWANFDGSNGAVSGSGNISSVSRTGTGLYQVNFSTAMPDANYSVCTAVKPTSGQGSTNGKVANIRFDNSLSTSFFVIYTYSNGGAEDFDRVLVSVFR